ncbi:MAG TPA: 50S ribosomal protein L20, partial [Dehalococcoidia bacterium]|nr:50S ribosomal protein L20 [Dehalococcoidia bacterium]
MARARSGPSKRRRHKAVLSQTKGHRLSRHALFRQANESLLHALRYSYEHRRD